MKFSFFTLVLAMLAGPLAGSTARAQNKDLTTLVEGDNQFALDLYHQLGKKAGNKFFSPYSISTALGMTYGGAKGQTAQQMAQTLHFTLDNDNLHPAFGELIRKIQGTDKKRDFQLTTANSLWGNKTDLKLNPQFLRITQTDYQAGFQLVDFIDDPEGSRKQINAWVEDKTNKKIQELHQAAHDQEKHPSGPGQCHLLQGELAGAVQQESDQARRVHHARLRPVQGADHDEDVISELPGQRRLSSWRSSPTRTTKSRSSSFCRRRRTAWRTWKRS